MLFPISQVRTDQLESSFLTNRHIELSVLRLDDIHPVVSGNKLFKLHYFLGAAIRNGNRGIITFGGAYSNHLVATAYACKHSNLKSIGIVRGEQPAMLSTTLQQCIAYGMELLFVSRDQYKLKDDPGLLQQLQLEQHDYLVVPEGGYGSEGAKGAALIMDLAGNQFNYICTAVGTATTLAGLLIRLQAHQQLIGFHVLKGITDIMERLAMLIPGYQQNEAGIDIRETYHFGGYAKKTDELISFMNRFYEQYAIPTDFVYTGKMMFGVFDMIEKNNFPPGSKILCVHTGGLQGNLSLPAGTLIY